MADSRESEQRLSLLRRRWEEDRTSLAFLPLAEEYRRLGRLGEALSVLEAGLAANPNYRSAHVALGRCRLELGDVHGAIDAFEQVLGQDPTQLVANKLLVEAYLRADRPAAAQDRLDMYALLNERDPELPILRRRIAAEVAEQSQRIEVRPLAPVAEAEEPLDSTLDETGPAAAPVEEPVPPRAAPIPVPAPVAEEVFSLPSVAARPIGAPPWLAARVPESGEPFSGLGHAGDRERYLRGLASGGVFGLPGKVVAEVPQSTAPATAPLVAVEALSAAPPAAPEPLALAPLAAPLVTPELAPPPVVVEPRVSEVPVQPTASEPARPAQPELTATLGELYLRQGHLGEAEGIFRRILEVEPANLAALAGLEEVRNRRRAVPSEAGGAASGVSARKASALRNYLERVRRGASRHVS